MITTVSRSLITLFVLPGELGPWNIIIMRHSAQHNERDHSEDEDKFDFNGSSGLRLESEKGKRKSEQEKGASFAENSSVSLPHRAYCVTLT